MNLIGHRLYVFEPGILQNLGSWRNWYKMAVTATNTYALANGLPWHCDYSEYFCTAIGRAFRQEARVINLGRLINNYDDFVEAGMEIHLVVHSNGAGIALRVFTDYPDTRVAHLHLVCAACERDFMRNGLNTLIGTKRVGRVSIYRGGKDKALRLAKLFGGWLGYGDLGLEGPSNVLPSILASVTDVTASPWDGYGHSDCWGDSFYDTMRLFWI